LADLPDSGWLSALGKVELWVCGAIALAVAILLPLWWFDVPPFNAVDRGWRAFLAVAGLVAACLFVARFVKYFIDRRRGPSGRLKRPFEKLSEHQRKYMAGLYRRGRRDFEVRNSPGRWFEELSIWNFIEWVHVPIISAESPSYYNVTEAAWQRLAALDKAGKLPR
jgi:hypothetical protein